jgi:hypothetical protein
MAKGKIRKGEISSREADIDYIMQAAVKMGIQSMQEEHPTFGDAQEMLMKHIDLKKLRYKSEEIYSNLRSGKVPKDRIEEYIGRQLTDYVTSGEFFDATGNKIFVERGIKEKKSGVLEKFVSLFKQKSPGEEELNRNVMALQDAYAFYKSGGYEGKVSKELGETLEKAGKYVAELKSSNFAPAVANIFEAYGVMHEKEANRWRTEARKNYQRELREGREYVGQIKKGIESYLAPEKVAASVFAGIGIFMALASTKFTGAVVGAENSNPAIGLLGLGLIAVSALIFVFSSRKRVKRTNKKMVKKHKR